MVNIRYKNAYKEVLEIMKYLPKKDLDKIPKEKIEYFERNQNVNHDFEFDVSVSLEKQNISREANSIILNLYNDYFLSDKQKEKLAGVLEFYEKKYQEEQREKYNPDNIFKDNEKINNSENDASNNLPVETGKKNMFMKVIEFFKKLFTK